MEIHNLKSITPKLVILVPVIIFHHVDMYFAYMFGVMLILSIHCLFVMLRLAVRSREPEDHPGTWILKAQASCDIDHFYLSNNILYNHLFMHRFNFDGSNRSP